MARRRSRILRAHASGEELHQRRRQSGQAFDILFMQLMLRHHLGGIEMAQDALQPARFERVRQIARAMLFEQARESARMRALLKVASAQRLPLRSLPSELHSSTSESDDNPRSQHSRH